MRGSRIFSTNVAGSDALLTGPSGEKAGTLSPSELRLTDSRGVILEAKKLRRIIVFRCKIKIPVVDNSQRFRCQLYMKDPTFYQLSSLTLLEYSETGH